MISAKIMKEELCRSYPYRMELHAHTRPVSPCSEIPADELVQRHHRLGVQGVVITNHALPSGRNLPQDEWAEQYLRDYYNARKEGERLGVQVLLGMEIRFPDNDNDYLVYGIDDDFVALAWNYLDKDLATFYRECSGPDRVILQAHPFRNGMVRADPNCLDGIEAFNLHPNHNSRVAMAVRYHTECGGVMTGGTDFHHPGQEGCLLTRFKQRPVDSRDLAQLLKEGDYIFDCNGSLILP